MQFLQLPSTQPHSRPRSSRGSKLTPVVRRPTLWGPSPLVDSGSMTSMLTNLSVPHMHLIRVNRHDETESDRVIGQ